MRGVLLHEARVEVEAVGNEDAAEASAGLEESRNVSGRLLGLVGRRSYPLETNISLDGKNPLRTSPAVALTKESSLQKLEKTPMMNKATNSSPNRDVSVLHRVCRTRGRKACPLLR
jgi:hypothetical protein